MTRAVERWQQWMQECLLNPVQANQDEIDAIFVTGKTLTARECLSIYQRGYSLRLTRCLAEQFPALNHALGEALFTRFAHRYLRAYPSDSYTLYDLGRRFAAFLEEDRPDREKAKEEREGWIDFMVDLANYERLHFSLFDAPGHEGNAWPGSSVPDASLTLQPCFELATYRYPVGWYYHAIKDVPSTPFPPSQTSYVALLRREFHVTTFPVSHVHYLFLQHLVANDDIEAALRHVSRVTVTPLAAVEASWQKDLRVRWIEAGFFVTRDSTSAAGAL